MRNVYMVLLSVLFPLGLFAQRTEDDPKLTLACEFAQAARIRAIVTTYYGQIEPQLIDLQDAMSIDCRTGRRIPVSLKDAEKKYSETLRRIQTPDTSSKK